MYIIYIILSKTFSSWLLAVTEYLHTVVFKINSDGTKSTKLLKHSNYIQFWGVLLM